MTTSFSLRVRADGQTEVLERTAVVIETFARAEHARQFYDWMAGGHLTLRKAPDPEIEVETAPAPNPRTRPELLLCDGPPAGKMPRPVPVAAPVGRPTATPPSAIQPAKTAVVRLPVGRARKAAPEDDAPAPPAMALPAALVERRQSQTRFEPSCCRLCGRGFMPSISEPETCARCARVLVR